MKTSSALPDRIADFFVANIAAEKLEPGTKLPPYRQLAESLDVDQTSLRVALRVLTRMGLISSVQGSGMRVNDYRKVAGLDFIDNLYQIEALELGSELLGEALDIFIDITPRLLPKVLPNLSDDARLQCQVLLNQLVEAAEAGKPAAELASLDISVFDVVNYELPSLFAQLALNSSEALRLELTAKLYASVDAVQHTRALKAIFMSGMLGDINGEEIGQQLKALIVEALEKIRGHLTALPAKPTITQPIIPGATVYLEIA
ncbi:hypothetical protein R50073_21230 [Maricurvus nonylphenolicus]|uniref:FadR/GntR family transcriptional regulator n=1 Tax=Maricurvus nonylphenolicus TaxID=1008307 RepID=UPI0036F37804